MTAWPEDRPFKVTRNIATGDRLTRTIENREFFPTEAEARVAFSIPRVRNECSRTLQVLHFGKPNNYGGRDTMECLGSKRFRKS
jgi:hypothetical protein